MSSTSTPGVPAGLLSRGLFVAPEARDSGAGRALIESLVALGKGHGWRRGYWRTHEHNYRARTLYDRVVARTDYVRYDVEL